MKRLPLAAVLLLGLISAALAQSAPHDPAMTYGIVPTVGQWNNWFEQKQDSLGYTPVNRGGDTMQGKLNTLAPTSSGAGFNLSPGSSPASPADGDLWTTNDGLYVRIDGKTVGPIRNGNVQGPSTSVVGDIPTFASTDGSTLQDSGKTLPSGAIVGTSDAQTLTNKQIDGSEITSGVIGTGFLPIGTTAGTVAAGNDSRINGALQSSANLSDLSDAANARTNLGLAAIAHSGSASDLSSGTLATARLPPALLSSTTIPSPIITHSLGDNLTSAGSTQATALLVTQSINAFTSVASGTGAILPTTDPSSASISAGYVIEILNAGTNSLLVYPPSGQSIEGQGANNPVTVAAGGDVRFIYRGSVSGAGAWYAR